MTDHPFESRGKDDVENCAHCDDPRHAHPTTRYAMPPVVGVAERIRLSKLNRDHYAVRVLYALSEGQISVGKACQALTGFFERGDKESFSEDGPSVWDENAALREAVRDAWNSQDDWCARHETLLSRVLSRVSRGNVEAE